MAGLSCVCYDGDLGTMCNLKDKNKCWDNEMEDVLNDGENLMGGCDSGGSVSEDSLKNKYLRRYAYSLFERERRDAVLVDGSVRRVRVCVQSLFT